MSTYEEIYKIISKYADKNSDITNNTYASKVRTVLKTGKKLEEYNDITSYLITKYTQKTYKSFITSIVVFLKAKGESDLALKYASEMKRVNDIIQQNEKEHIKTDSEMKNMISSSEIEQIISNLSSLINRPVTPGDMILFVDIQKYLVINLYYLIQPLRNDYVGCEVYENPVYFQNPLKNYIFLSTKKLVLNRYKTSKTYGKGNEIDLPDALVEIISKWMTTRKEIFPELSGVNELLLTKNLQPMSQVNLTQFLNRIFQRKVSSTILRKSFITEKYPVTHTTNEMQRDAIAMQHSVAVQQTTYRKK